MPAVPSVCPKQDLLDISVTPRLQCDIAWLRAPTSMGSPRGVPVPCTLSMSSCEADRPPAANVVWTKVLCAGPLGAVSPLLRPPWLTPEPRSAATVCPAVASAGRCWQSTRVATPSARPYPSALDSKDLQRPTGDRACKFAKVVSTFVLCSAICQATKVWAGRRLGGRLAARSTGHQSPAADILLQLCLQEA